VRRPEVAGAAPPPRMCHTTARVAPPAGSQLGGLVAAALRPLGRDPAAGALLATFGGCSPHSEAYSGDSLEARPALVPPYHFSLFSWPQAPLSCIAGVQVTMGGMWCLPE